MATEKLKRALGFRDVFLFYIVSSLSLRWIATAAAAGQSAVVVWVIAWCGFFLPLDGCVLELSSRFPQEGGLYVWTREAYGEFAGFMAAWTYWMSNLPYFGSVLYFAASSLLFASPRARHLADANIYYVVFTISMLALITVLNVLGLGIGKWLNNLGAVGMAVPVVILLVLGMLSFSRFGSATHFTMAGAVPRAHLRDLIFWSTIFFAFSGCECASFMGDEIKDARRVVPRALLLAGAVITIGYIAGTVAMLVALPSSSISGLGGFMTAIDFLCRRLGLAGVIVPVALLVGISNIGAAGAFLTATARLPFVAGVDHYLPPVFGRIHPRWKTPYVALIVQAALSALFIVAATQGDTVRSAYQKLVNATLIVYFIPYLYMFAAAVKLRRQIAGSEGAIPVPGGAAGNLFWNGLGFLTTLIAIVLALIPPADAVDKTSFLVQVLGGSVGFVAAGLILYALAARRGRTA